MYNICISKIISFHFLPNRFTNFYERRLKKHLKITRWMFNIFFPIKIYKNSKKSENLFFSCLNLKSFKQDNRILYNFYILKINIQPSNCYTEI